MFKIIVFWIINNILKILKIKNRDKNIWLFGSWGGETYSDNAKYFFEYIVQNHPEINAIWITKSSKVKDKLNEKNLNCYLYNEINGYKVRLNAKYVFFTNGITDIGNLDLSHGSTKVALWHGMPLKKLAYATNNLKKRHTHFLRFMQYVYLKIYNPSQRDISIATSITAKRLLKECFELEDSSILITGQPRNDILFEDHANEIRIQLKHNHDEKFILYMPTWRDFGKEEFFLDNIIQSLYKDSFFVNNLKKKKVKLYIKPHPRIKITSKTNGNIVIIDNKNIDSQKLIASADVLITDYSSVFIDYALLNRPIFFYTPDLEEYKSNGNDLLLDFSEFSKFRYMELSELKEIIVSSQIKLLEGNKNTENINAIFDHPELHRGSYSETLYKALIQLKRK